MNYYISDLHLCHQAAIGFDNRPFANLDEMHKIIINNWNNVIKGLDNVYILGDVGWKQDETIEIIKKLKGKKHLILGNHDKKNKVLDCFSSVNNYLELKDNGLNIVLSHYPIAHWNKSDYGSVHLYGHIHEGRESRPFEFYKSHMRELGFPYFCYNVGCMLENIDYTPRTLKEIMGDEYPMID